MTQKPITHILLFALFPIISFALDQWLDATFLDIVILGTVSVTGAMILWGFFFLLLKDSKKAALLSSFSVILFFSFGYVRLAVLDWVGGPFGIARYRYLFSLWAFIFLIFAYGVVRLPRIKEQLTRVAGRAGLIVSIAAVLTFAVLNWEALRYKTTSDEGLSPSSSGVSMPTVNGSMPPDIYYIITDGYARSDVLKEVYEFDNSEFIKMLEQKGFYIPSNSRSNYAQTFLSLTSSLNMDYLIFSPEEETLKEGDNDLVRKKMQIRLEDNRVVDFLRSQGYNVIYFGSTGWAGTARNRNAHINIYCGLYSEFITAFIRTTFLEPWPDMFQPNGGKHLLCTLDKLKEAPDMGKSPRFVFAHLIAPHPPCWFGADGELIPSKGLIDDSTDKQGYKNQVRYINKRLADLIETIFEKSKTPPIIVIQADHGPSSFGGATSDSLDWNLSNTALIKERMPIFNALYFPGVEDYEKESVLYPGLTPINTFRIIFNRYFGAKYELLPDKSYFSAYKYPYQFLDVTHNLKN